MTIHKTAAMAAPNFALILGIPILETCKYALLKYHSLPRNVQKMIELTERFVSGSIVQMAIRRFEGRRLVDAVSIYKLLLTIHPEK